MFDSASKFINIINSLSNACQWDVKKLAWEYFNIGVKKYFRIRSKVKNIVFLQFFQDLGLQLQELQASCILNAEKMKLNIEILRARDQEARVFRADQKKKISRLDLSNLYKSNYAILAITDQN